ncbi:MAG TPA: hypothetical protein VMC05_03910, partial [Xanthobacteraceae bacterium]|nr:hypothetical protein [Xanthobacteraceae bacterium]
MTIATRRLARPLRGVLRMPIRFADILWPSAEPYWLVNARVPACMLDGEAGRAPADAEGIVPADILIESGRFAALALPGGRQTDAARVDIGGRQVWSTLIDIHTHLDKGHTVDRSPNSDGTFNNARLAAAADRVNWTVA